MIKTREDVLCMQKITRNAIRCKHCGDVIESVNRHDFVTCSCGCCSADGGHDYLRRGYLHSPEEDFEEMSACAEIDEFNNKEQN